MDSNNFKALFQVLSSEQQILMRTDQKAENHTYLKTLKNGHI